MVGLFILIMLICLFGIPMLGIYIVSFFIGMTIGVVFLLFSQKK